MLFYANWTQSRINSLTLSCLKCLFCSIEDGSGSLDTVQSPNKCCLCLFQGRVAGLLRPRPFLNKLSNALASRKFCERHNQHLVGCPQSHCCMKTFNKSVFSQSFLFSQNRKLLISSNNYVETRCARNRKKCASFPLDIVSKICLIF